MTALTLTHSTITSLPRLIPSLRGLQMAVEMRAIEYGQAAMIEHEADEEFDNAIDAGLPSAVRNDLAAHANLATELRQRAQGEWEEAKKQLLDLWN